MATTRIIGLFLVILLTLSMVACGEEVELTVDNDGTPNGQEQPTEPDRRENQDNREPVGPEDCGDDEVYNPTSGQCVEVANNGEPEENSTEPDQNDQEQNDASPECPDGEVWNPDDEECIDPDGLDCGPGDLIGTACRPDGANLGGAQLVLEGVDCDGNFFSMSTTADGEGNYSFNDVPSGTHELTISSGSFEGTDDVDIFKGVTQDLTSDNAKVCLEGESVNIAVVFGSFDDIGSILSDMALPYDGIDNPASFFSDMSNLRDYDIIFVECGATWPSNPFGVDEEDIISNISQYVQEGYSLYASDLAYRFVDFPFGSAFEFSTSTAGSQTIEADVVSQEMQTLLGSTTTEVVFNLGGVRVVESVGPATEVQFQGDVSGVGDNLPLMSIYYDFIGGGRSVYTSFHNSAQATGNMQEILEFMIFQL